MNTMRDFSPVPYHISHNITLTPFRWPDSPFRPHTSSSPYLRSHHPDYAVFMQHLHHCSSLPEQFLLDNSSSPPHPPRPVRWLGERRAVPTSSTPHSLLYQWRYHAKVKIWCLRGEVSVAYADVFVLLLSDMFFLHICQIRMWLHGCARSIKTVSLYLGWVVVWIVCLYTGGGIHTHRPIQSECLNCCFWTINCFYDWNCLLLLFYYIVLCLF